MDTYRTFGCDSGQPTFRYSLIDGVKDGYLINPVVVDARTDVTTQLLSDEGYSVIVESEEGKEEEESFFQRDFEKKFFSEDTNRLFCSTFLKNALKDPVSREIGKTIVFAVSQNHAAKLTQVFNEIADKLYPDKYRSDFAVQVTSVIPDAQQFTINFSDKSNNLMGTANLLPWYKTSKARVCVTVGMMTTGYDCTDILNICLMRPIFSPTDFVQIKGRGTRRHKFEDQIIDQEKRQEAGNIEKKVFKLFDFFGNCEYFEEKFNYDEVLKLPQRSKRREPVEVPPVDLKEYERFDDDYLTTFREEAIGFEGMKIDRMFFEKFQDAVKGDYFIRENVKAENWDKVLDYLNRKIMNKPEEFFTPDKLRKSLKQDRQVTLREMLKYFFKTYIVNDTIRKIINEKRFADLAVNPVFPLEAYKAVPPKWRSKIPEYIQDYVPLNKFIS